MLDIGAALLNFKNRYVVRAQQPWRDWSIAGAGIIACLLLGYALYVAGHARGAADFASIDMQAQYHRDSNTRVRREFTALRKAYEQIRRSNAIQMQVTTQLRRTISRQQTLLSELREEVLFYRAIAVDKDRGRDLRVVNFQPSRSAQQANRVSYKMVLSRVRRDDQTTSAQVRIRAVGTALGEVASIAAEELNDSAGAIRNFQFRHFYRLSGELVLPANFSLLRLIVTVTALADDGGDTVLEESYPWPPKQ